MGHFVTTLGCHGDLENHRKMVGGGCGAPGFSPHDQQWCSLTTVFTLCHFQSNSAPLFFLSLFLAIFLSLSLIWYSPWILVFSLVSICFCSSVVFLLLFKKKINKKSSLVGGRLSNCKLGSGSALQSQTWVILTFLTPQPYSPQGQTRYHPTRSPISDCLTSSIHISNFSSFDSLVALALP